MNYQGKNRGICYFTQSRSLIAGMLRICYHQRWTSKSWHLNHISAQLVCIRKRDLLKYNEHKPTRDVDRYVGLKVKRDIYGVIY